MLKAAPGDWRPYEDESLAKPVYRHDPWSDAEEELSCSIKHLISGDMIHDMDGVFYTINTIHSTPFMTNDGKDTIPDYQIDHVYLICADDTKLIDISDLPAFFADQIIQAADKVIYNTLTSKFKKNDDFAIEREREFGKYYNYYYLNGDMVYRNVPILQVMQNRYYNDEKPFSDKVDGTCPFNCTLKYTVEQPLTKNVIYYERKVTAIKVYASIIPKKTCIRGEEQFKNIKGSVNIYSTLSGCIEMHSHTKQQKYALGEVYDDNGNWVDGSDLGYKEVGEPEIVTNTKRSETVVKWSEHNIDKECNAYIYGKNNTTIPVKHQVYGHKLYEFNYSAAIITIIDINMKSLFFQSNVTIDDDYDINNATYNIKNRVKSLISKYTYLEMLQLSNEWDNARTLFMDELGELTGCKLDNNTSNNTSNNTNDNDTSITYN